ncbi:hybrid sensor histidine kinase/response regulator [uncultured Ramlibacter sp.]|mgnify:CR=1 FL=1|uniref:ATP-binding response regulator n=1 Tax=uncultured Ramlibacter sp. TaxID=260755 RepID=UPI00262EFCA6|nr:hybrid sensor histidine kinase/response regulator [uncultured Ramlibacter sp.]
MLKKLFEHYHAYHAYGPPRLKYMGFVGMLTFMAFYFLRFTRPNPQPFDDIAMRGLVVLMMLLLALKDQWPARLKRHYIAYSYVAMLYCLPFFTVFNGLERGGGIASISNGFITLCFVMLLTDWRNTFVMLTLGTGLAVVAYVATDPDPRVPMDMVAQLPAYLIIAVGGNLFKFSTEQIDAERKLRATQALAGSIAHEMRNPLSQLKHSLEGMKEALPLPGTDQAARPIEAHAVNALYRHLANGEVAVRRGLQVIAMTLDEVNAKPLDTAGFAYLSAAEATHKAVQEYGYENDDDRARIDVRVLEDFSFRGDETAWLFLVFNLLKNALYYLPAHPQARITITIEAQQVRVRDNGPGMAPQVLAHLFEPFRSVGKSGGTGLGLAYCQRVMRAFGGQISCAAEQGQYTEFTMRFPPISLQESQAHLQTILARARSAFAGRRLLLVDDDAIQRSATRHKLETLDAVIDEAAGGLQALELLALRPYDLVLLDLNMPSVDGFAVAQAVRRGRAAPNRGVRIVAYTSEPAHLAEVKVQKAGMDAFVGKPCAQLPLVQALHQALMQPVATERGGAGLLAGRHILLADDNHYNRKAVAAYLRHAGAQVHEAGHGQAVLDHLQLGGSCDAVLMDINMPGLSGLDAAQAIRASGAPWHQLPIIALTAHSDPAMVQSAQAAGMNDFITKPVDAALLYAKLQQLMGGSAHSAVALDPLVLEQVLDPQRLESYRRIGMLDELLADYLPEISRLVDTLDHNVADGDLQGSLDTLHSLLGMSGEAGATALYQLVRRFYVPMAEGHCWPPRSGWVGQIQALAGQTEQALQAYAAAQSAARAT